jgi:hypothetical protein
MENNDHNTLIYFEVQPELSAMERVKEIEDLAAANDWGFEETEAHCIAVLDSEFMNYPQDILENVMIEWLNEWHIQQQEDCV